METLNNAHRERARVIKTIAGSLLLMFPLGIFAEFVVRNRLISWTDPLVTLENISKSLSLFNAGILAFLLVLVLDLVLAMAFYRLMQPAGRTVVLSMALLRVFYIAIKAVGLVGLLLARDMYAAPVGNEYDAISSSANQAMQFLKMHHYGFSVGLFFFGLHLLLLGYLIVKMGLAPKWIAWLVAIAGLGYAANSTTSILAPNAQLVQTVIIAVFILPMSFAELLFGYYLWRNRNRTAVVSQGEKSMFLRKPFSNPA